MGTRLCFNVHRSFRFYLQQCFFNFFYKFCYFLNTQTVGGTQRAASINTMFSKCRGDISATPCRG
uniref:Uncharacterized protein n=1 Tax=Anguilla anguilla TaxID=7936 RepID=A0A0E9XEJ8_ANGAN